MGSNGSVTVHRIEDVPADVEVIEDFWWEPALHVAARAVAEALWRTGDGVRRIAWFGERVADGLSDAASGVLGAAIARSERAHGIDVE